MIVTPLVGEITCLDTLIGELTTVYRLYVGDTPLTPATMIGDFTQASFPGYLPATVATWTDAQWITDRIATVADLARWTCTADGPPQVIYGYYVTNGVGDTLLWAERRDAGPVTIQYAGDTYSVQPYLSVRNQRH